VHGGGTETIACIFDITSKDRDECNRHLNEQASQGCYYTGRTKAMTINGTPRSTVWVKGTWDASVPPTNHLAQSMDVATID
jgi:hypothetical protein